jgi:hypothetical protein
LIIFDEKKYAENLIKNGYENIKYITMDNIILVKYWKSIGLSEEKIRNKLKLFMIKFQELFNDNIIKYKLNSATKIGMKYDLLTNICVDITQSEIEKIQTLESIELQKMMFIFLIVWKFKGSPKRFKISNTDLMNLSSVKVNSNTFWDNIHKITQTKMLDMVEYKNKSYYQININEDGDKILHIDKFDNVINYYMSIIEPEKYIHCECGTPFSPTNNRQKYCRSCWKDVNREKTKENMKLIRNV